MNDTKQVCKKCGGDMQPGHAIEETFAGVGDFNDSDRVVTLSPSAGSGNLVPCLKCVDCGWSITL